MEDVTRSRGWEDGGLPSSAISSSVSSPPHAHRHLMGAGISFSLLLSKAVFLGLETTCTAEQPKIDVLILKLPRGRQDTSPAELLRAAFSPGSPSGAIDVTHSSAGTSAGFLEECSKSSHEYFYF